MRYVVGAGIQVFIDRLRGNLKSLVVPCVAPGEGRLETVPSDDLVPLALLGGVSGVDDRAEIETGFDREPEARGVQDAALKPSGVERRAGRGTSASGGIRAEIGHCHGIGHVGCGHGRRAW
jgi:hypothetical protein